MMFTVEQIPLSHACSPAPIDETAQAASDPGDGVGQAVTAQGKLWDFQQDPYSHKDQPVVSSFVLMRVETLIHCISSVNQV